MILPSRMLKLNLRPGCSERRFEAYAFQYVEDLSDARRSLKPVQHPMMSVAHSTHHEHKSHAPRKIGCMVITCSDTRTPETDTSGN